MLPWQIRWRRTRGCGKHSVYLDSPLSKSWGLNRLVGHRKSSGLIQSLYLQLLTIPSKLHPFPTTVLAPQV